MSDPLVLLAILVLGCAAFLFGLSYAAFQILRGLGRGLARLFHLDGGVGRTAPSRGRLRVCREPRCRRLERRPARFCSQCGSPVLEVSDS